jgi:hypothetical protein
MKKIYTYLTIIIATSYKRTMQPTQVISGPMVKQKS